MYRHHTDRTSLACSSPSSRAGRKGPLSDSTNVPRRIDTNCHPTKHHNPLLSLSRPRKAPPTVSISSANATCPPPAQPLPPSPSDLPDVQTHSQSVIPFPSSPVECPMSSDIDMRDGTSDEICLLSLSCDIPRPVCDSLAPWSAQTRLRKRRSLACAPQPRHPQSTGKESSGDTVSRKRPRKSRQQVADLQFMATVHRSLITCIRSGDGRISGCSVEEVGDSFTGEEVRAQDMLLASRLWQHLLDQGCTPVSLEDVPVASSDLRPTTSSDSLSPAEMYVDHAETPQSPLDSTPPRTPIESRRSSPPPPSPTLRHADVLSIPQLVAIMVLQHNDRSTIHTRPGWRSRRQKVEVQTTSPTSRCCVSSSNRPCAHNHRPKRASPLSTTSYP
ncbi:hypothetical protein BJ138DRAFT_1164311 [Hygrophoropsis aurantiaca]|uniref:Uncharacterized protein n=1 Tax=Hygrophoropsis aurantiaca TaxID=72124 RepID=A0ACB7ZX83_9AGAM|nr:hypothetical protein BJ138DRAFT_1164311 [Hygrophoropsis aurantiaca]